MSRAGVDKNPQHEIEKLFEEIDDIVSINDVGKESRLGDARNTLNSIRFDLVGLKRMLIQHPRPDAPVQELGGAPLGQAIRDKIKQAKRLEDYIAELEDLPDDPQPGAGGMEDAKANGDGALQAVPTPDKMDDSDDDIEEE